MADLPGAVIVVTGASSGIGRATALGFARKGARLVLVSRSADALDKVARECADLGSEAVTFAADMADDAAVERMRSFAVSRFGRIDVWVNCAAVLLLGRFEEIAPPLQSGAERPYRMQSLLGRSHWDADRLRDEVRDYVVEALGDEDGVLIVDETGFVKKGDRSAGVARQYSGTAGRIENSHVGVFFAYASRPSAGRSSPLSAGELDKGSGAMCQSVDPGDGRVCDQAKDGARHGRGGARCRRPVRLRSGRRCLRGGQQPSPDAGSSRAALCLGGSRRSLHAPGRGSPV